MKLSEFLRDFKEYLTLGIRAPYSQRATSHYVETDETHDDFHPKPE